MSKTHRGAGIRENVSKGRGTCPICKRTAIKLYYETKIGEESVKICKQCNAKLKNAN